MKGKFYGVNIGFDWKSMTIRAKEALEDSDFILYDSLLSYEAKEVISNALGIIDTTGKKIEDLFFPEGEFWSPEGPIYNDSLEGIRRLFTEEDSYDGEFPFPDGYSFRDIRDLLDQGHNISIVTSSPYGIDRRCTSICVVLQEMGYETEVIPGITRITHQAAMAKLPLTGGVTCRLSMWKGVEEQLEKAIVNSDSIIISVVRKCHIELIVDILRRYDIPLSTAMVLSDLGTDNEYVGPIDPEKEYATYSTVVIQKCGWD